MWFYSVVFFLLVAALSAGYFYQVQKATYWSCVVLLILIAAFRPQSCCKDYAIYLDYYANISGIPFTFLEPTYFVISWISKVFFNSAAGVFIIYSILGVGLKGLAFTRLTKYYSVTLVVYFGTFFLLHEMTQIRVGIASALLLLSIPSIVDRDWRKFFCYLVVGVLFHYSFIIFGFFYFLNTKKINPGAYMALIAAAIVAVIAGVNLSSIFQWVHFGFISDKIAVYRSLLQKGVFGEIMLLNPLLLLRIAILLVLLYNWEFFKKKNRHAVVLIKVYAFSIFSFIAFSDLPVLAGRISQLLGIVEIIVVPFVVYLINPKYFAVLAALLFGLMLMYKQLYYSDLLNSYF